MKDVDMRIHNREKRKEMR